MKALKWALIGLGAVVLIAVAVVASFVATFDPNDYKPRIVELVKRQTGRTLALDGKIGLTFLPKIGAVLGKVTLSEPNSPAIFARVDEARVAVALLPLLFKHVIVDRVTLTGLAVDLARHKDGRTNFDDLMGRPGNAGQPGEAPARQSPGSPMAVDIGGITIDNATIGWRDEVDGTDVRLSNVTLKTGTVDLDPKAQRVTLSGVELTAKTRDGLDAKVAIPRLALAPDRAESQAISADVALATPPRTVSVKLQIAPIAAQGKRIELSRLDVDLTAKQPDLSVQGKLATLLTVDLEKRQADLPGIAGNLILAARASPTTRRWS